MSSFSFSGGGRAKHTLNIERFRGADFANNPFDISIERSPDCCNLIPDLSGYPVCRPAIRAKVKFAGRINGIHILSTAAGRRRLVHHGDKLSWWQADGTVTQLRSGLADNRSRSAQLNGKLCIFDGKCALLCGDFSADGGKEMEVRELAAEAYIPTTTIGRKAGAMLGGTAYEEVNLIGQQRKNTFCVESTGQKYLYLDCAPVQGVSKVRRLMENGVWIDVSGWSYSAAKGYVKVSDGLAVTPVSSMDNYEVTFTAVNLGDSDKSANFLPGEATKQTQDELVAAFSGGSRRYAIRYWFALGQELPKQSAEVVFKTEEYYTFVGNSGVGSEWQNSENYKKNDGVYALTATTTKQTVELGYKTDGYENEDAAAYGKMEAYVQLIQEDGVWYLVISQPATYGIGGDVRVYVDSLGSPVTVNWRESNKDVYAERINGCTICQVYGVGGNADRLFISGNGSYPNMDWYSGFNDPTYWPDLGYTRIGSEGSPVIGYSWLADGTLAVHKQADGSEPTVWYRNGSLNSAGEAVFTLTQGAVGVGAVSRDAFVHFGDDNLCLSEQGVFAITRTGNEAVNERFAQNRSWFINPRLCQEEDLSEAQAISFMGRCFLAVNDHVYIADAQAPRTYVDKSGAYQYDWWYWEGVPVRVWYAEGDKLMFGAADGGIYYFDPQAEKKDQIYDTVSAPISCWWHTPILDLGTRAYFKKLKNAYAVAEPFDDSCVKVDYILQGINRNVLEREMGIFDFNDVDFSHFTFETDPMPRNLPSNSKAKKVMFVQFKLYNEPGAAFGLYGFSVLYTVSGKYKGQ